MCLCCVVLKTGRFVSDEKTAVQDTRSRTTIDSRESVYVFRLFSSPVSKGVQKFNPMRVKSSTHRNQAAYKCVIVCGLDTARFLNETAHVTSIWDCSFLRVVSSAQTVQIKRLFNADIEPTTGVISIRHRKQKGICVVTWCEAKRKWHVRMCFGRLMARRKRQRGVCVRWISLCGLGLSSVLSGTKQISTKRQSFEG